MIHQEQRHRIVPPLQTPQEIQTRGTGIGSHYAVAFLISFFKIALDGSQDIRIVVDR
jgi:hypothetical protein